MFSPHPDDETLACGGTISKAIKEDKKVKIVFLTNGDAYPESASIWLKKKAEELTPQDYLSLGEERQKEALSAAEKLGLKEDDLFFLSYPDAGLDFIWKEEYNTSPLNPDSEPFTLYKSAATKRAYSSYKKTYSQAIKGYAKENILTDIKDILKKFQPKRIYLPYFLDQHKDHSATARFVSRALKDLIRERGNKWVGFIDVFYYPLHNSNEELFSRQPNYKENVVDFKNQKTGALRDYHTQIRQGQEEATLKRNARDEEIFCRVPNNKKSYLEDVENEWIRIAEIMHKEKYGVNLAPVVDVAGDSEDMGIYLVKRERLYSQDPYIVTELAYRAIKGMNKSGITAVLKHFPGLGRCRKNPHTWLPRITASKKDLDRKDLLPFKELIGKKGIAFWIMIDHAIYPALDQEPASLSYKIQTGLLRKELGFKGIIIADELLCMQAIQEYAREKEIKNPYIGEIVIRAFQAGTDLVTIYAYSREAEKVISDIIGAVKQAIKEGRISQRDIDDSLKRILKSKENVFKKPLMYLLKEMSLEEKICQKIVMDAFENFEIFQKHNLGGMHARVCAVIEEAQRNVKIPMFIINQHEGGLINDPALKLYTSSAYSMGTEFERLAIKAGDKLFPVSLKEKQDNLVQQQNEPFIDYYQLGKSKRQAVIYPLLASMNRLVALWSKMLQEYVTIHPNMVSALIVYHGEFSLLPYEDLPIDWVRRFPDQESARYAYGLLKKIFKDWQTKYKPSNELSDIVFNLKSLKKEIEAIRLKEDNILAKAGSS